MLRTWKERLYQCNIGWGLMKGATLALTFALTLGATAPQIAAAGERISDDGDWAKSFLLRGRVIGVLPENTARYNIPVSTEVSDEYVPELDISYFFTENFAVETICCAVSHDVNVAGGPALGKALLLPVAFFAQYHFHLGNGVKPYIGAGPALAIVASDSARGIATSFDLDTYNPGYAIQAGIDFKMKDNWYFNVDIKKFFVDIDATVTAGGVVTGTASIDPIIAGIGIGYKF